ncbi:BRCT domain-containing protein [Microbispora sp. H10670]|uniref:BRCT domain-containing protein n=1 Tax=Microbispora sp. H10670 TaxID=2729108 RepID=UPI0021759F95|nr:BRCT domain-containing protein [Microbispora sp. H10670]
MSSRTSRRRVSPSVNGASSGPADWSARWWAVTAARKAWASIANAEINVLDLAELSDLIDKLVRAGVNMVEPDAAAPAGDEVGTTTPASGEDGPGALPLTGMTVVVTGAMSGQLAALSRNQMNELIERAGGRASSSVSAKTSLVVAGDAAGSKRAKAESLGVRIASPEEFAEMVAHLL